MNNEQPATKAELPAALASRTGRFCVLAVCLSPFLTGCSSISNPVANGIPVRRIPAEFLAEPKNDLQTIPLASLRKKPEEKYILGPGDTLGIWIEGVLGERGGPGERLLGERGQLPPVIQPPQGSDLPPAIGLPIVVREDGTLALPEIPPLKVEGMSLQQAEEAIRKAYTVTKEIIKPGRERIFLSLIKPRTYRVLVIRQDSFGGLVGGAGAGGGGGAGGGSGAGGGGGGGGGGGAGAGFFGTLKRGAGFVLDLSPEENDVLTALTKTGGLPGLNARDEVIIERGVFTGDQDVTGLMHAYESLEPGCNFGGPGAAASDGSTGGRRITRIPLRMRPNQPLRFRPEDIVLRTGDIVFIEARIQDVWYGGGFLFGGPFILPRDRDLDIVEAVALAGFALVSPGVTLNNLSGAISAAGPGFPPPSLATVIRKTPDGGQIPIRVEMNVALRDPRERILIMPNDVVILQFKPEEAFTQYLLGVMSFNFNWLAINTPRATGNYNFTVP